LPNYRYEPVTDTAIRDGSAGRVIFALDALAEAGSLLGNNAWANAAVHGLQCCVERLRVDNQQVSLHLEGRPGSPAADCELLAALASWLPSSFENTAVRMLARQTRALFHHDGMISHLAPGFRMGTDHDILPGVALVALGRSMRYPESAIEPL